jgi:hypothetical protein
MAEQLNEIYTTQELREAFVAAGLDTHKYKVEYLAEQIGFVNLNENLGDVGKWVWNHARKILNNPTMPYLDWIDQGIAPHVRKIVSQKGIDAVDIVRQGAGLAANYSRGLITPGVVEYVKKRMGKTPPSQEQLDNWKKENLTFEQGYLRDVIGVGEWKTPEQLSPEKKADIRRDSVIGRPGQVLLYNSNLMNRKTANNTGNAYYRDEKTGKKKKYSGTRAHGEFFYDPNNPLNNSNDVQERKKIPSGIMLRNIDKPFSDKEPDTIGGILKDIKSLKHSATHEATHSSDFHNNPEFWKKSRKEENDPNYSYKRSSLENSADSVANMMSSDIKPKILTNVVKNTFKDFLKVSRGNKPMGKAFKKRG